jgi:hypothetical protein
VFFGYAWTDRDDVRGELCGTWDLGLLAKEDQTGRMSRLSAHLDTLTPSTIVYQERGGFKGIGGTHFDSFLQAIGVYCHAKKLPFMRVYTADVKRHATGNEYALDREVILAAQERFGFEGTDPRQAHALFVLDLYLRGAK